MSQRNRVRPHKTHRGRRGDGPLRRPPQRDHLQVQRALLRVVPALLPGRPRGYGTIPRGFRYGAQDFYAAKLL